MLRFDYQVMPNNTVNITIVEEKGDTHSMCGRLVMSKEMWITLNKDLDWMNGEYMGEGEPYKFEDKNEK